MSFDDVDAGIAFPKAHCAFAGCGWVFNGESDDPFL